MTKMLPKAKAKLKKGKLIAKVKYPLVGKAEIKIGETSKLKALVKVPFIAKAKLFGFVKNRRFLSMLRNFYKFNR